MVETVEESRRNLRAVEAICACLEAHDLAGADALLAPGGRIRTSSLFAAPGTPATCHSFEQRFGEEDRAGRWKMTTESIEQLGPGRFLVTAAMVMTQGAQETRIAGMTGSIWECREGRLALLTGFSTAHEARAAAAHGDGASGSTPGTA